MKRTAKKLHLITALLLIVGMMMGASNAALARAKTKTIPAGSSVNLSVKGKAKWAISNTAVARMTVLSQNRAKVTGLRQGTTKITAKVGGKKYRTTIKVKSSPHSAAAQQQQAATTNNSSGGSSETTPSTEAQTPQISNVVEGLSSAPISGSIDSVFYLSNGAEVVGHFDDGYANDIIAQTNNYRSSNGVSSLGVNPVLIEAARTRAAEASVAFGHTRPNGTDYYTVGGTAEKSYQDSPVFGENLAYGYNNAGETVDAWIASQGHKENLLRDSFTTIGVAVLWVKQSDGSYLAYVGQLFG